MTFEWLPMINPYVWPFSVFNVLTGPYFAFWARVLPSVKLERTSVEISGIIAVEALNSVVFFCMQATNYLIVILQELEEKILNDIE
jgi:1,4-dihydroxy-2-naphthoate octaprenyltransferase